jgi:hypothetical protein
MKRAALLSLILCSTMLLSGCSYSHEFFIINNSNDVLEIEYKWSENLYSTPYKFRFAGFDGSTVDKLETIDGFTKEEIDSAEERNLFRISLEPRQALRIHSITNEEIKNFDTKVHETFRINFLSLKGKSGSIELTDDQVWFQFRKMNRGYFISYE